MSKTITITETFDKDGKLVKRVTETRDTENSATRWTMPGTGPVYSPTYDDPPYLIN